MITLNKFGLPQPGQLENRALAQSMSSEGLRGGKSAVGVHREKFRFVGFSDT